jgi:pyridinium-3,5-biscarboxylic acid mononucleotide synthase
VIREHALHLLQQVLEGRLSPNDAVEALSIAPFESLGFATVDHHRALRQGHPEVVFGQGKTSGQIAAIVSSLAARGDGFLVTRASPEVQEILRRSYPQSEINEIARTVYLSPERPLLPRTGIVSVVTAGTSDLPVSEEAAVSGHAFGLSVTRITDVGVAGIHRVLDRSTELRASAVVIVVAGMDGALASVIGGLVRCPVIAVPTSVGYGASFGGLSALLAMLNCCAAGVTVVNIDNGFGAAVAAARIVEGRSD